MSDLRQRIAVRADEWGDGAARWLAEHPDVSVAEIHHGVIDSPHHYIVYRFTLPTGADLDWDPDDGWDGPSTAMEAVAGWVRQLTEQRREHAQRVEAAEGRVSQLLRDARVLMDGRNDADDRRREAVILSRVAHSLRTRASKRAEARADAYARYEACLDHIATPGRCADPRQCADEALHPSPSDTEGEPQMAAARPEFTAGLEDMDGAPLANAEARVPEVAPGHRQNCRDSFGSGGVGCDCGAGRGPTE